MIMQEEPSSPDGSRGKLAVASVGGAIVAAFASSICCVGPLVFGAIGLGVGGAGLFVGIGAYRPYLAATTVMLLGAGYYLTYRRRGLSRAMPVEGPACDCERPRASRLWQVALWVATSVVAVFLFYPYLSRIAFG
jgi:mercuric ion transport protein